MSDINCSSLFLVSGGGKGITARCVIKLAETHQCRFILLGRTSISNPEPKWAAGCHNEVELRQRLIRTLRAAGEKTVPLQVGRLVKGILAQREIEATLQAVRNAGGQAEYLSVDITDLPLLKERVDDAVQRLGRMTGIVHGAGALADKLIEKKSIRDFETVYAAKVKGLGNLLACVPAGQLEHLVLFSSAAGFFGNIGQSDYALANEILNKTAHLIARQHPSCRVCAPNWGPWDGGMVTPELKRVFAERDIQLIPVEAGTQALVDELASHRGQPVQVLVGSGMGGPHRKPNANAQTHRVCRKLTLAANPFLKDHVIGGYPVLPTVCAMSWMADTCEQLYPGFRFSGCTDYQVLKGIVFDNTLADEYVLDAVESPGSDSKKMAFETLVWSRNGEGKTRYHYRAHITLLRRIPPAPTCDPFDRTQHPACSALAPYEDGTLFHGSGFRGVSRVLNLSPERVTLECMLHEVHERVQGQFPVQAFNPYTADVTFQSMLIWTMRFRGSGSLPSRADKGEHFRPIPFDETFYVSMEAISSSETTLVANTTVHDIQGRVYFRVFGAQVTFSKHLNRLFQSNGC